jgi:hypothetical protein
MVVLTTNTSRTRIEAEFPRSQSLTAILAFREWIIRDHFQRKQFHWGRNESTTIKAWGKNPLIMAILLILGVPKTDCHDGCAGGNSEQRELRRIVRARSGKRAPAHHEFLASRFAWPSPHAAMRCAESRQTSSDERAWSVGCNPWGKATDWGYIHRLHRQSLYYAEYGRTWHCSEA